VSVDPDLAPEPRAALRRSPNVPSFATSIVVDPQPMFGALM
jgi:hypothetical protein